MTIAAAQKSLRIGFLSPHNPYDRRAFSGTAFYTARALAAHPGVDLHILGAHRPPSRLDRLFKRTPPKLENVTDADLDGLDGIVGLVGSQMIDQLRTPLNVPLIYVTDATPAFLREDYGWTVPPEADAREARVLKRADAVVYSSQEMAARAAREFGAGASAVPFGINFETSLLPEFAPDKAPLSSLNLLFVGNDWARKGGEIAVDTLTHLHARGIKAHLTIVGRVPTHHKANPHITSLGYLDKNRPAQAEQLARAYSDAHVLVVPSRADCTPMVAAEAMAFGTPVLASNTGGLSSLIGGSGAGWILPLAAKGADWAEAIAQIAGDQMSYEMMSDASFDRARGTHLRVIAA